MWPDNQPPMDSATAGVGESITAPDSRRTLGPQSAEDLAWLGLIPATLLLVAAFFWLAPTAAQLYPRPTEQVFPAWQVLIRPEPLEATRFLIAAAIPPIVAVVVLAVGTGRPARRSLDLVVVAIQLMGIAFLGWSVAHQISVPPLTSPDYFDPLLLSVPNILAGVAIGIILTAGAVSHAELRLPRRGALVRRLARRKGIALAVAVAVTAVWLLPAVVTDGTLGQIGGVPSGHIPSQAEDYFAVVNGRTPLVNYIPLYAHLLPMALAPVLSAFDCSLTSFSISMCLLSLVALLAVYATFSEVTGRPWAALALYIPFLAISLFPWDRHGAHGATWEFNGNYYGFFPDRYLGPFVVIWLCALSIRRRRLPPWVLFFAAALTAINNPEFGVPCLLALVVALQFGADRSMALRARIATHGLHGAAGLLIALALFVGWTVVRSGELPDPALAVYWSTIFSRDGYGLAPMPTLGLHWALYFTYAATLLTASVRYVRTAPDRTLTAMLAFAGAFGLMTGFYFAGRSLPYQLILLFPVWGFALALLTWTIVLAFRPVRGDLSRLKRLLIPAFAVFAGFGVMTAGIDRFPLPWQQVERLSASGTAVYDLSAVQRLVEAHTNQGDHVLILGTLLDHRVAERAGVVNTSPFFDALGLLSESEVLRALGYLEDEGGRKIFEVVFRGQAVKTTIHPQLAEILRQRGFEAVRRDPINRQSALLEWRLR
jgi:hypothetical protein